MPYRYAGLEPVPDGEGIVRPGEIRDKAPQDFGPWEEIPGDDAPEKAQDEPKAPPPPAPSPAPAGPSSTTTPPDAGNGGK